ncbi:MAG: hypothetical protein HZA48_06955 [Planctomycetes bacterium]|nr:hypothetical protein [Planctomycetota bacterium]
MKKVKEYIIGLKDFKILRLEDYDEKITTLYEDSKIKRFPDWKIARRFCAGNFHRISYPTSHIAYPQFY